MPLIYTTQLPTKPGWYWLKESAGNTYAEYIFQIEDDGEGLTVLEGDFDYSIKSEGYKTTLWAGPIDKPMDEYAIHI